MWNTMEVCHHTQRVSRGIGKSGLLCCGAVSSDRDSDHSVQRESISNPILMQASLLLWGKREKNHLHEEKDHPHTREPDISPLQRWPEGLHRMSRGAAKSTAQTPEGQGNIDWSPRYHVTLPFTTVKQLHGSPSFHRTKLALSGLSLLSGACQTAAEQL